MMYTGLRGEAIWKDMQKPYAIGLDIARVSKRNTYGDFSILNKTYTTVIGTVIMSYRVIGLLN